MFNPLTMQIQTKRYTLPRTFGEKWIEALRTTPEEKHGYEKYYDAKKDCYCSMGLGYRASNCIFSKTGEHILVGSRPITTDLFWELVHLNDNVRASFLSIASWLEQNVQFI